MGYLKMYFSFFILISFFCQIYWDYRLLNAKEQNEVEKFDFIYFLLLQLISNAILMQILFDIIDNTNIALTLLLPTALSVVLNRFIVFILTILKDRKIKK